MTIKPRFEGASPIASPTGDTDFLEDVWSGLSAQPKVLSPKYFYDSAGSALFEEITVLPEYYPTRTELRILDEYGPAIAATFPARAALIEFGSGSTLKLRRLLRHRPDLAAYVPVDVSAHFLHAQAAALREDVPGLAILPVAADFTRPFTLPGQHPAGTMVGFFPGSTIGNFDPDDAIRLLEAFGETLGPGAILIIGVDLAKDRAILEAAYDDSAGVTAAFNRNLLTRINRELKGDFDLSSFRHRAFFNEGQSRIEMHLESRIAQEVSIAGRRFRFSADETIHTESSYKFTIPAFRALGARSGWTPIEVWTDPDRLFSVHALRLP